MGYRLVLLRHGHSEWNLCNRFTGWTDIALTKVGLDEATKAGRLIANVGLHFDEIHLSLLQRTHQTAKQLLHAANHPDIPHHTSWRLNERHYGRLQGMNKEEIFASWGVEQSRRWWRGFHEPPPALDLDDPRHPRFDPLYHRLPVSLLPHSESLAQCQQRLLPYWHETLAPRIRSGRALLVISHGNTLRSLRMYLEKMDPAAIEKVEIPSAVPLIYQFDRHMRLQKIDWLEHKDTEKIR